MPSGQNNMDNKSDDQLLIVQATIESNKQDSDEKMKKLIEYLKGMIASMIDQIKISELSPIRKDFSRAQNPTIMVPANKKAPLLESGNYTKIGGM